MHGTSGDSGVPKGTVVKRHLSGTVVGFREGVRYGGQGPHPHCHPWSYSCHPVPLLSPPPMSTGNKHPGTGTYHEGKRVNTPKFLESHEKLCRLL